MTSGLWALMSGSGRVKWQWWLWTYFLTLLSLFKTGKCRGIVQEAQLGIERNTGF